jgi:hypothetical protein
LEEFEALLGDVLLDDFEDLVVLEILSGDIERKVLRINYSPNEAEVLRDEFLAVVHDEDSSHVKLDVVFLLLGLEHVEGSTLGHEDDRFEFKTALY